MNSVKCLELLLNNGAKVNIKNKEGKSALFKSINHGSFKAVKILLKYGANIKDKDYNGMTLLHEICYSYYSDVTVIQFLIDNGLDVNAKVKKGEFKGWTALDFIYENEYFKDKKEDLKLLLKHGAKRAHG